MGGKYHRGSEALKRIDCNCSFAETDLTASIHEFPRSVNTLMRVRRLFV